MRKNRFFCVRIFALMLAAALLFSGCSHISFRQSTSGTETAATAAPAAAEPSETEAVTEETTTQIPETTAEPVTVDMSAGGNPVPVQRTGSGVNPITGMPGYDSAFYANRKLIGIVVENHPGARPQWGMSTADVVFEYEVEGGISRMLWLYANADEIPAMVGPIRSMRHDIVELARGFDLFFVHCGGSPFAREKIASYNGALARLDGNGSSGCFVRNTTRDTAIEHRLILMGDSFRRYLSNTTQNLTTDAAHQNLFRFADANAPFRPGNTACSSVHFEYSGYYTYTFNYNDQTGLYEANINGSPRVDDQNVQCAYKNLLILYVDMVDMQTEKGHQDLLLEKGGKGFYAANGSLAPITWKKGTDTDMLKLYDAAGNELTLNAGKSYIGLVRSTQESKTVIA